MDSAEPAPVRKRDSEFEKEVRRFSQEIVPVQPVGEAEPPRVYSGAEVQHQMDYMKGLMEGQNPREE